MKNKNKIWIYILTIITNIFILQSQANAEVISVNTTISTDTTYTNLTVTNGATLTIDAVLTVNGDATIQSGGNITHTAGASSNFNLIVSGTLDINTGGKIDVSLKGLSSLGAGTSYVGASHGGYNNNGTKAPYGDIYNPITVGSYGVNSSYAGGGLVRMTVGNLINNGSILTNGGIFNSANGQGAGGSINILVNGLISGNGIYQANGGTYYSNYSGAGGRIAIKYNSVSNLTTLKNNISATGPEAAGEGTIYLKNNTSANEYLLIKGDGGTYGTTVANLDLNSLTELVIDGGGLKITGITTAATIPYAFQIINGGFLDISNTSLNITGNLSLTNGILTVAGPVAVNGDFNLNVGSVNTNALSITNNLNLTSGTISIPNLTIPGNLTMSGGTINSTTLSVNTDLSIGNATINNTGVLTVLGNGIVKNLGVINNSQNINVSGNLTVQSGGNITHPATATSLFNLVVNGTLDINTGGKIDVSLKGLSSLGAGGTSYIGGSHGGYNNNGTKAPYGDIYNPITVGSYGVNSSYAGGGLVRMTVGNLINNGSILTNGGIFNSANGQGAGGSINILVNGLISGNGIYQANGGTYYSNYSGAGGRIAIKYNSVSDLTILKTKLSATGPEAAGEGTIYLKNNTSANEYLLIKGDGTSGQNTGVGTGYTDYYFDTIEVSDGAKLYKVGSENIVAGNCVLGGSPIGIVGPGIVCNGITSFKYYDFNVSITKFDIKNRKYEYVLDGPAGGYQLMGTSTGVINGNGTLSTRIKLTKLGNYNFRINLYDGNSTGSLVEKTTVKNVSVTSN